MAVANVGESLLAAASPAGSFALALAIVPPCQEISVAALSCPPILPCLGATGGERVWCAIEAAKGADELPSLIFAARSFIRVSGSYPDDPVGL